MRSIFIPMMAALILVSACSPTEKIITVQKVVYPEMPEIQKPLRLNLENCEFDYPRDIEATPVEKNLSTCIDHQDKESVNYRNECLEHPIDKKSNLFVGYTQEDYLCTIRNTQKIREHIRSLNSAIESANKTRKEYQDRNRAAE